MEKRIFYYDTDAGGVVYYANYLKYTEEARTAWFISKGIDLKQLANKGILFVVKKVSVNYRAPASYGDIIYVDTEISRVSFTSIKFIHRIFNKQTQKLLNEAEVVLVCVNSRFKPCVIPDDVKSLLLHNE